MKAPVHLWLTEDLAEVVADGDPRSRFLLAGEGCDIPEDEIRRLGVETIEAAFPAPAKSARRPANKEAPPADNKSGLTITKD